ncbi:hypothetical protein Tsubulata_012086 [Turnera subulata]|uniref:DUF676 domain-containing protein n=1 Tax=Turnera subulata TaxID=218843 RepID=A0A9Q0J0Y6_9ROSI|nr:hypothetical protein Tsubulata_012086 [Turnera subulata]
MIAFAPPLSPPELAAVFHNWTLRSGGETPSSSSSSYRPRRANPLGVGYGGSGVTWGVDRRRSSMDWVRRVSDGFFKERSSRKGIKVEFENGGVDVFDAAAASEWKRSPDHLVIMVNGIVGSSADWRYAAEQFVKKLPDKVIVHRSECNYSKLTFDGVDLMGDRLAEEVLGVVRRRPEVRKISFVAHSLGGLVARYAVARLFAPVPKLALSSPSGNSLSGDHSTSAQCLEQPYGSRIAGLEPINFITFATPHLGSRGNKQLPFLCGLPFLERRASQTAHLLVGRTGKHLFLTDKDDGKPPLLLQMVNDSDDLRFISALRAFRRRVAYANANYDHMVGWRTSSIRRQSDLPKSNLLVADQKYPHIVYVEQEPGGISHYKASPVSGDQMTVLEEEMIKGLNQVPWERVDVSFHKSRQRYVAHSTIQASVMLTVFSATCLVNCVQQYFVIF